MPMARASDAAPVPRRWAEHTVTAEQAGLTVEQVLTGPMQISRRMLQRLTRAKGVLLNRRPAFLKKPVRTGDVVAARLTADEEPGLEPVPMSLHIVHEDTDVLLLDKPAGLLVHPTSPRQRATLAHGVAHHFQQHGLRARVRAVHRIDRDVTGLVLFAKSAFAHQHLDRQLRERTLRRRYLAWVAGRVADDAGIIDAPIGRHKHDPVLRAVRPNAGDPARTRFHVLERHDDATQLSIELETGRTHQVRVHLAHLGHPLLGDTAYGGHARPALRRPALHAWALSFVQPTTGERLAFECEPPDDLRALVRAHGG
jgi:23S rRNA pseudouridine1911/1915/1917 synthase